MSDGQFQYTSNYYQFDTCIVTRFWFYSYAMTVYEF